MRLKVALTVALLASFFASSARAQDYQDVVFDNPLYPVELPFQVIEYGKEPDQLVRFNRPKSGRGAPLVFFVGDGGWHAGLTNYPLHLLRSALYEDGYAFAAVDYNQGPRTHIATEMLANITAGFHRIYADADSLGYDRQRIIIIGSGSGGHFAALLGTDPTLLGDQFAALKGIVSINGDGFDIAEQIERATSYRARALRKVFGDDFEIRARLSPTTHLAAPNAPAFLFQSVSSRQHLQEQATGMSRALNAVGSKASYTTLSPWRRGAGITYYGWDGNGGYADLSQFLRVVTAVAKAGVDEPPR